MQAEVRCALERAEAMEAASAFLSNEPDSDDLPVGLRCAPTSPLQSDLGWRDAVSLVNVPRINGGSLGGGRQEVAAVKVTLPTSGAPAVAPAACTSSQPSLSGFQPQRKLSFRSSHALILRKLSFSRPGQKDSGANAPRVESSAA